MSLGLRKILWVWGPVQTTLDNVIFRYEQDCPIFTTVKVVKWQELPLRQLFHVLW